VRLAGRVRRLEQRMGNRRCDQCDNQGRVHIVRMHETPEQVEGQADYSQHGCPGCGRVRVFRIVREDPVI
jgi:molybdenum cofactor biosynthesis enzyme MoaA